MKPIYAHLGGALALTFAIAACVPQPRPAPPVQARPAPSPAPPPAPPPQTVNWMDAPATPGDWYYRAEGNRTLALFGGEETEADFILRCERGRGEITLAYAGEADAPLAMRVRTETAERVLTARPDGGALPYLVASLPARDRLFDAMALSKGRFAVEVAGREPLYLPSWAEVTRVVEDCR
jgi:hypothetical protein